MRTLTIVSIVLAAALGARAEDRAVAQAMAAAGAVHASKGNDEQAKDYFFKALANDENCGEALYELGRLYEKEGNPVLAGEFYERAAVQLAGEKKPALAAKRADAEKRLKAVNPLAVKLNGYFEDYARDLDRVASKLPDSMTLAALTERAEQLSLAKLLPPEKTPKFLAEAKKNSVADVGKDGVAGTSPEVERELKALGWTKVTGSWVKKGQGVYETKDGKLEAERTNGAIDLYVLKGSSGTVKACVRNNFKADNFFDLNLSGYGVLFKGKECRLYGPNAMVMKFMSGSLDPALIRADPLPDANPKNHAMVNVNEGSLDYNVNDKRHSVANNKLPREGGFVIEVTGMATLETPRCIGR